MRGTSYYIPAGALDIVRAKFGTLARRAAKLGLAVPTMDVTASPVRVTRVDAERENAFGEKVPVVIVTEFYGVTIFAPMPSDNGFTFVATLMMMDEGSIVLTVPGETIPEAYRTATNYCDACKTSRYRSETYVVRNDATGDYSQVGGNCLQAYIGAGAHRIADFATMLGAFESVMTSAGEEGGNGGGSYGVRMDTLETVLAYTSLVIRACGWKSAKYAQEYEGVVSTRNEVNSLMNPPRKITKEYAAAMIATFGAVSPEPTADDVAAATAAIEFASAITDPKSDYESNVAMIARGGVVPAKLMGIAVSILPMWQRAQNVFVTREAQKLADAGSVHVGTVGAKIETAAELVFVKSFETQYGTSQIVKFRTVDGNVMVWFASNSPWSDADAPIGKAFTVKGTVKNHDTRDGVAQTIMTRCKVAAVA